MSPSAKKAGRRSGRKKIYWDTCVLLAWILNEKRNPTQMAGLTQVEKEIAAGRVILITSAISRTEIFEADLTDDQK